MYRMDSRLPVAPIDWKGRWCQAASTSSPRPYPRLRIDNSSGQNNDPARLITWTGNPVTDRPLQDANNRCSAVVDAAIAGDPQRVTQRGKSAVVVPAVEEYERLRHLEKAKAAKAPTFADLLIAMPQDDEEFERLSLPPRSTDSRCF